MWYYLPTLASIKTNLENLRSIIPRIWLENFFSLKKKKHRTKQKITTPTFKVNIYDILTI